jgi:hypothetical protein
MNDTDRRQYESNAVDSFGEAIFETLMLPKNWGKGGWTKRVWTLPRIGSILGSLWQ